MIIEITIQAFSRYNTLSESKLTLDSDDIDETSIITLTTGMAKSVLARAENKLAKEALIAPPPVAASDEPL